MKYTETIDELLTRKGIEFKRCGINNLDYCGITKKGTNWHMDRAGGAYGFQMSLTIGNHFISHILLRNAIKKILTE